ncbi:MAG: DUF1846 domain-containing protein [Erysipelotrichaceae bacterium]|nr:DUF1846 domain-containing protein [Erysipelotrichaceae bacterium]
MIKKAFDSEKYLSMQRDKILERIQMFNGKLYMEFGGKMFQDYHASRVLPGYDPNNKIKLLLELKEQVEIIICINANNIENSKARGDLGISYDQEVFRLIDAFKELGLYVGSVVITQYAHQNGVDAFRNALRNSGIQSYLHYPIKGYPTDVDFIVSSEGLGKNQYIPTTKDLVVVTAPGPGSGKMATCISQLYHDAANGIHSGYAKFESFPVWNLSLHHPVNLAYEAATCDLDDINMIDPFHLEAYGKTAVNYNRDIEIFPVLNRIIKKIMKDSPYKSPTDMGVNMAGNCICDDEVCREASKQEIIRRYYHTMDRFLAGSCPREEAYKIELLMNQAGVTVHDRKVVDAALDLAAETDGPAAALELPDGKIVTGKTSKLLGASAALILNALKELAGIDHSVHVISPAAIEPIQKVKTEYLGSRNPRLHIDEVLIALSISASTDPVAELALNQIPKLKGCQAHTSVMLANVDVRLFQKLSIQTTSEPKYEKKPIYQ